MSNKLILIVSVIAILVLGAIAFTVASPNSNRDIFSDKKDFAKNEDRKAAGSSPEYQDMKRCNPVDNRPCFRYYGIMQERGNGHEEDIEQTRLEPCPKPKRVCPLCREELKQTKGEGHMGNLIQTKITC